MVTINHPMDIRLNKVRRHTWDDESKDCICHKQEAYEKIHRTDKMDIMKKIFVDKNRDGIPDIFQKHKLKKIGYFK